MYPHPSYPVDKFVGTNKTSWYISHHSPLSYTNRFTPTDLLVQKYIVPLLIPCQFSWQVVSTPSTHNFSTLWWILTIETLEYTDSIRTAVKSGLFPDNFGWLHRKLLYAQNAQLQQPIYCCCCYVYNHISATLCATLDINVLI
jgi:hypothetical protein